MKAEVVWRLMTAQKWPNTSGFTTLSGVSLTKRQQRGCSLNLSVNWNLNDWGGRWGLQQKQRNLVDGAGMGRKSHCCVWSTSALPIAPVCRIQESSLWSCWTSSCPCLALWLSSLLSQPCKVPHPDLNHMHWDGVMLGEEPVTQGTRGGQASLVLTNLRKTFQSGSFRKPRFLWGRGTEGSAHVSHCFPGISEGRPTQIKFGFTVSSILLLCIPGFN